MKKEVDSKLTKPHSTRLFRASPEVENLYQFIYEFNLRRETKLILGKLLSLYGSKSKSKGRGTNSKKKLH